MSPRSERQLRRDIEALKDALYGSVGQRPLWVSFIYVRDRVDVRLEWLTEPETLVHCHHASNPTAALAQVRKVVAHIKPNKRFRSDWPEASEPTERKRVAAGGVSNEGEPTRGVADERNEPGED